MKLLVLFIAAASAVTIFPGEDSLAQETNGESKEHLRGRRTRFLTENSAELKAALSGRPRQHRKEEQNRLEHPKQSQAGPVGPETAQSAVPSYFANILEEGGQKLGYSSYIQHHGEENDASPDGSVEIKKVIPKSSVQVEMYHGPSEVVPQQPHKHHVKQEHKEVSYTKHKSKPAKYYQETVSNYKKPKPSQIYISSTPGLLVNELIPTTPSYASSEVTKYKNTLQTQTKRKPYSSRHEYKGHENLVNHNDIVTHRPATHYQLHSQGEKKNPGWKALSETVEIASSNDYIAKQPKIRKPKQVIETSFPSHQAFYDPEPERFKAERFDHEKALRGSTSFGISNAVGFGPTSEFGGEEVNLGNFFNNLQHADFAKALEAESARGPVTFQPSEPIHATSQTFPIKQTIKTGGYQIPVMTEEEFEKHFGKIDNYRKPEVKFNHGKRLAFDARAIPNTKPTSSKAISFSQFNSGATEWAPHAPAVKQVHSQEQTSIDSFPAYSFNQPSRRNVSIVPERIGKVLSDDHQQPQQFSVSASYKIDRNHSK